MQGPRQVGGKGEFAPPPGICGNRQELPHLCLSVPELPLIHPETALWQIMRLFFIGLPKIMKYTVSEIWLVRL